MLNSINYFEEDCINKFEELENGNGGDQPQRIFEHKEKSIFQCTHLGVVIPEGGSVHIGMGNCIY